MQWRLWHCFAIVTLFAFAFGFARFLARRTAICEGNEIQGIAVTLAVTDAGLFFPQKKVVLGQPDRQRLAAALCAANFGLREPLGERICDLQIETDDGLYYARVHGSRPQQRVEIFVWPEGTYAPGRMQAYWTDQFDLFQEVANKTPRTPIDQPPGS